MDAGIVQKQNAEERQEFGMKYMRVRTWTSITVVHLKFVDIGFGGKVGISTSFPEFKNLWSSTLPTPLSAHPVVSNSWPSQL